MKLSSRVLAVALVGVVSLAQAQDRASVGVQADQRIPEDTFVYFSIPSVNAMKARMAKSHSWGLFSDPAFDDFKKEVQNALGEQMEAANGELEENLGVTAMELLQIPSGQFSFAISESEGELGMIMFADFGDSRKVVDGLLKKAQEALAEDGIEMATETYSGTEMHIFAIPNAEENPLARELVWAIRDTELVVASNKSLMKQALSNWDGSESDTFVANSNWAYVKERCSSGNKHGMLNWYVDPIGAFDSIVNSGAVPQAGFAAAFLPTLGLDKLDGMGGVMDVAAGKYDVVSKAVYLCEDPSGILKVFTLKEGNMAPPKWVPADVTMYSGMNWDVTGAYGAVETLMDSFSEPGALSQMVDGWAQEGPGIHVKDDLIDQLTGMIQMIGAGDDEAVAADPNIPAGAAALLSSKMAFALGCKDEAAMKKVMSKLTDLEGFPGEVREFRDTMLVEMPNPQGGPTLGMGVVQGNFVVATDVKLLEAIARGESDSSLVASDAYKKVAAEFPSKAMAISFVDARSSYKGMYEGLRKGDPAELFPGMGELIEEIDFTKLPKFDAIAKYLLPTGGFTVRDDRGAFSQSFSLAP